MLTRLARLNLRRCIHTPPSGPRLNHLHSGRLRLALGASVVAATYFTWRWASGDHHLALDAQDSTSLSRRRITSSDSLSDKKLRDRVDTDPGPSSRDAPPLAALQTTPDTNPGLSAPLDVSHETTTTATTSTTPETDTLSPDPAEKPTTEEEEEGDGSGSAAFNPVTGEINWDCPCLGGMAHGPCGLQFRAAFECFVFSEQEPKGVDCVEKFKAMQECFREHPDVYADEIMRDEEEEEQSGLHPENEDVQDEQRPPANHQDTKSDSTG